MFTKKQMILAELPLDNLIKKYKNIEQLLIKISANDDIKIHKLLVARDNYRNAIIYKIKNDDLLINRSKYFELIEYLSEDELDSLLQEIDIKDI